MGRSSYVFLSLLLSVFIGCSRTSVYQGPLTPDPRKDIDISDEVRVSEALKRHFTAWAGTPYRDGGSGRNGIDCSGFVQNMYASVFGVALPRTTRQQARFGIKIARPELRPADLVFFKTRLFGKHVGVYKGGGQFIHVSSKRGVSVSYLGDEYWSNHFWQARRILN